MKVTVLMAVYNGGRYVAEAVESVLAQTLEEWEFLVIDDGSTDETPGILARVADPRVRVVRNAENVGLTRSLNRGLELARGDLIARQDADDRSLPARLERQLEFFQKHPETVLLGTQAHVIGADGRRFSTKDVPCTWSGIRWWNRWDNPFIHTSVMFRQEAVGRYDERFVCCQDYELWSRVMKDQPVANLRERLVELRLHSENVTLKLAGRARALTEEVVRRELPGLGAGELAVMLKFRSGLSSDDLERFDALVKPMVEDREDPGVREAVGMVYWRAGYGALEERRGPALRMMAKGLAWAPELAREVPWARVGALALMGGNARRLYEKMLRKK